LLQILATFYEFLKSRFKLIFSESTCSGVSKTSYGFFFTRLLG
jgi:hypothetical protein